MGAPPHCSSPRLDHVLPRRGYSQRLVCLLHQCAMSSRHCSDPLHLHCRVLVVWWCPVRQSLNLLAFYPLNMKCIDDRNCHIIHEPAMRKRRKVQVEIMKEKNGNKALKKKFVHSTFRRGSMWASGESSLFLLLCQLVNITRVIN